MTDTVYIDPPISFGHITRDSMTRLWQSRVALSKGVALPLLMLFTLSIYLTTSGSSTSSWWFAAATALSAIMALTSLAVIRALDPAIESTSWLSAVHIGRHDIRFLGYWYLLLIPGVVFAYLVVTILQTLVAAAFAILVISWFAGRLILVYPAAASGNRRSILWAWKVSDRHEGLLFSLILGYMLVQAFAGIAIGWSDLPAPQTRLLQMAFACVAMIGFHAMLYQTYQRLCTRYGHDTPQAAVKGLLEQPFWRT